VGFKLILLSMVCDPWVLLCLFGVLAYGQMDIEYGWQFSVTRAAGSRKLNNEVFASSNSQQAQNLLFPQVSDQNVDSSRWTLMSNTDGRMIEQVNGIGPSMYSQNSAKAVNLSWYGKMADGDYTLKAEVQKSGITQTVTAKFQVYRCRDAQTPQTCCRQGAKTTDATKVIDTPCSTHMRCIGDKQDQLNQCMSGSTGVFYCVLQGGCKFIGPPTPVFVPKNNLDSDETVTIVIAFGSIVFFALLVGCAYNCYFKKRGWGGINLN